jgi:hypothetical protein
MLLYIKSLPSRPDRPSNRRFSVNEKPQHCAGKAQQNSLVQKKAMNKLQDAEANYRLERRLFF